MSVRHKILLAAITCLAAPGCGTPEEPEGGARQLDPDAGWIEGADGVAVRAVWAPPRHWILDMNSGGDLLLSTVDQPSEGRWLLSAVARTRGRGLPPVSNRYQKLQFLPFSGRSLNEQGQVLGPGTTLYRRGAVTELPDPCPAEVGSSGMTLDCYLKPINGIALADNGDVPVSFRKDFIGTIYSPYWQLRVWRAAVGAWVTLLELFGEGISITPVISPGGAIAAQLIRSDPTLPPLLLLYSPDAATPTDGVDVTGLCPAPYTDPASITPLSVNDAGDVVARVTCFDGANYVSRSVLWRRGQPPVSLDGVGMFVDESGNVIGERAGDGHIVVWMADGGVKDLSAVVASAGPVVVKKLLPEHQVFGTVERHGAVWRY